MTDSVSGARGLQGGNTQSACGQAGELLWGLRLPKSLDSLKSLCATTNYQWACLTAPEIIPAGFLYALCVETKVLLIRRAESVVSVRKPFGAHDKERSINKFLQTMLETRSEMFVCC